MKGSVRGLQVIVANRALSKTVLVNVKVLGRALGKKALVGLVRVHTLLVCNVLEV